MKIKLIFHARALIILVGLLVSGIATAEVSLSNPHWNIWLTDFGYSDLLLDNTPGFQGREYLSGEWGAAVSYQVSGGPTVAPQWLERNFIYPDWTTNSTFTVSSPLVVTGANADGLPIAQSVIANAHLEITQRFEMLDTITGIPMGTKAASAGGAGTFMHSNRYVLKQTYTVKNIAGVALSNLQLFQMLHGLNSQRGVYDNRAYTGALSQYRYDTTLAGVDFWAIGAGAGLEDFIGFHSAAAPTAVEVGYFGLEGNGADNHSIGKPSDGVHLSIEDNWQSAPFSSRLGTDSFAPPQRWVAGAQRWALGNLPAGQSVNFEVVLSILTGTKVPAGPGSSGSCDGGSSVPGGLDYEFSDVTAEGTFFSEYSRADQDEIAAHVAAGEFGALTFPLPGQPAQIWEVEFSGDYSGSVTLTFGYDPTALPPGFNENTLSIYHFSGGAWKVLPSLVDAFKHTITVTTPSLGAFALGVEGGGATLLINASVAPANSGTITGAGAYAQSSSVTLVAAPSAGYVFANWTESGAVVSNSPSFTFAAQDNRTFVANFLPVGAAHSISTSSTPSNGGTTGGDGAYAPGSNATVVAAANPGYKFSKWLVGGTTVSTSRIYTFPVTGDRALVAKFKPVFVVTVTPAPGIGGSAEADSAAYEYGEKAVMKAFPEPGYSFVNWMENGNPVSTAATFTFNVTGNRDLVANFALGYRIDVSASPKTAGSATGGGVYPAGSAVTVSAEPRSGYVFINWTVASTPVSTDVDYTFPSATNRTLVANFVPLPTLQITPSAPGALILSWPEGATGWILEESPDLTTWNPSTRIITVVGGQKQVLVTPLTGNRFFRLSYR